MGDDPRIPVVFGGNPGPDDAQLVEEGSDADVAPAPGVARFAAASAHPAACTCCAGREPVASALAVLFMGRARGTVPFFRRVRVVAGPAGKASVRRCLDQDLLTRARFRLEKTFETKP